MSETIITKPGIYKTEGGEYVVVVKIPEPQNADGFGWIGADGFGWIGRVISDSPCPPKGGAMERWRRAPAHKNDETTIYDPVPYGWDWGYAPDGQCLHAHPDNIVRWVGEWITITQHEYL